MLTTAPPTLSLAFLTPIYPGSSLVEETVACVLAHARLVLRVRAILDKLEAAGVFRGRPLLRRKAWGYFDYSCGYMWARAGVPGKAAGYLFRSLAGYPLPYPRGDVRVPFGRLRLFVTRLLKLLRPPSSPAQLGGVP